LYNAFKEADKIRRHERKKIADSMDFSDFVRHTEWHMNRLDLRELFTKYFDPMNGVDFWFSDEFQTCRQDQEDRFVALCLMNEIYNDLLEEK